MGEENNNIGETRSSDRLRGTLSSGPSVGYGEIGGYDMNTTERPDYGQPVPPDEPVGYNNLREINIQPLNSGYLVRVGCQSVAVETTEKLVLALGSYLTNPNDFERDWNKNPNRSKI